jgi:hypothetical protein
LSSATSVVSPMYVASTNCLISTNCTSPSPEKNSLSIWRPHLPRRSSATHLLRQAPYTPSSPARDKGTICRTLLPSLSVWPFSLPLP